MNYKGKNNWNMFVLCFMVFFKAKFVGYKNIFWSLIWKRGNKVIQNSN